MIARKMLVVEELEVAIGGIVMSRSAFFVLNIYVTSISRVSLERTTGLKMSWEVGHRQKNEYNIM